jgi:tRNA pseudouridine13 synthase
LSNLPDWARALGPPLFAGRMREKPEEFVVTEELDIDLSGDGEHDWLWIEKTGANTHWVAEQLARHAGVSPRDVGYAGLKDRHAVTRQWFSVRRPSGSADWQDFESPGVRILEQRRHSRKLKRGAHRGNRFRIAIRADSSSEFASVTADRLAMIEVQGVPNYFGEQRFGRGGANIALGEAILGGRRVSRHKRSIGLSALRSFQFNEELDRRVTDGTWNTVMPGDVANLDGTGSIFNIDELTPDLERRCAEMDIHPCGLLPEIAAARVAASHRPLRLRVGDLRWEAEADALWLEFRLGRGSYATAVLREIVSL